MTDESGSVQIDRRLSEEEFIALIVRHERRVCAFIQTLLPLDADVDDLMQEVSVVAWKKFPTFIYQGSTPDESFVSWLCTIAKFQVMNERKKRLSKKMIVPFDDALVEELASLQIRQSSYFEDRRVALAECLTKLTPREREVIRLKYGLGVPVTEIAEYLGRKQVTAYQLIAHLRSKLLECVQLTMKREGH
jgi:RNA polymerase sigma-70 factor (ECF subfamily)